MPQSLRRLPLLPYLISSFVKNWFVGPFIDVELVAFVLGYQVCFCYLIGTGVTICHVSA